MNLASSRLGQVIGRRGHVRGAYRLLYRSYAKASELPGTEVLTISNSGDHFAVHFRSYLEWSISAFGHYEGVMGDLWALLVRPGGVCIDVGANIGVHTVRLAKLAGPEGSVHAIEAWPEVAARLARNVELNGLVNVTIHTFAASSQLGKKLVLHLPARTHRNRGRASGLRHEYLTDSITVDTTTVDSLNLSSLDLIKIDVEGAEGPVIAGAAATIERCQPAIVAELNTTMTDSTSGEDFNVLPSMDTECGGLMPVAIQYQGLRICG